MTAHHLAQLNIARLRAPIDSPELADFVTLTPEINALAERSPGYVWRLRDESGDATALRPFEPDILVNLTVWESIEALRDYSYQTAHLEPLRRRRDWFLPLGRPHLVLWWIPAGTIPTIAEAGERLDRLASHGPAPEAFTLRHPFPAPEGPGSSVPSVGAGAGSGMAPMADQPSRVVKIAAAPDGRR